MGEIERLEVECRVRIERICAQNKISRARLARLLGVSEVTLWRWSRAITLPGPEAEAMLRGLEAGRLRAA